MASLSVLHRASSASPVVRLAPTPSDGAWAETIVRRLRSGDTRAAGEVWRVLSPHVMRVLRRGLGPDGDVDDLAQEVFLRLFRSVDRVQDPSALRSFVVGIAVRVLRKELRRRWIGRWLLLSPTALLPDGPPSDVRSTLDAREVLRRFYGLLDALGITGRTLFVLRHIEQLELSEVARATGVSLATVKRKLARAEAHLAILLARDPLLAAYASEVAPRPEKGADDAG